MKNYIIGTIIIIFVGLTVITYFFEKHPELTSPRQSQSNEKQEAQEPETSQPSPFQPIYTDDSIGYSLQNDQLQITFNKGSD